MKNPPSAASCLMTGVFQKNRANYKPLSSSRGHQLLRKLTNCQKYVLLLIISVFSSHAKNKLLRSVQKEV